MKQVTITISFFLLLLIGCSPAADENAAEKSSRPSSPQPTTDTPSASETTATKKILFYGNSLTAAYGLEPTQGFAHLIQLKIDSLGLDYEVVNAGLSGETTKGGLARIDWILDNNKVDVFVLELGGNDGLRGIDPKASYQNLEQIIQKVQAKHPDVSIVLAGMEAPPNMGTDFTSKFRKMYPELAKQYDAALIPFLLDGVGGIPELNLPDGIHPNVEGHQIVAENIWKVLQPILKQ
ncbi:MAG: arylesterase [Bacteroidota bacterium]